MVRLANLHLDLKRILLILLALAVLGGGAYWLFGRSGTTLTGTVLRRDCRKCLVAKPVADAQLVVSLPGGQAPVVKGTSDSHGHFSLSLPGSYSPKGVLIYLTAKSLDGKAKSLRSFPLDGKAVDVELWPPVR
jgi:hypothetical protein